MTEKIYQLPPEPFGPVIDSEGRTWSIRPGFDWHCDDRDLLPRPWHRLVVDHGPLTDAPEPAWPTAPYVWWDGGVWTLDNEGTYQGPGDYWEERHMRNGLASDIRDRARRFAREAIPVTIVPTAEWEVLRQCVEGGDFVWAAAEALVDATEALNGETNE